ncbi:MAG TPA: hypothetical protein VGS97_18845 [Actinocrinis sp.]|nr:hypothetical protein [Actinocrinis sp.]HEV2346164.1 hypothetical protein [Actinocrinis sp.]
MWIAVVGGTELAGRYTVDEGYLPRRQRRVTQALPRGTPTLIFPH